MRPWNSGRQRSAQPRIGVPTLSRRTPIPVVPHWYGTVYLTPSAPGSKGSAWKSFITFLNSGMSDMSSGRSRLCRRMMLTM